MRLAGIALAMLLAACAAPEPPAPPPAAPGSQASLLPGSIGVVVTRDEAGVRITQVKPGGAAEAAGLRPGDIVVRFNDERISSVRQFNRLVLDSQPGARARLELLRGGSPRRVEVPVRQLDTMPRG